MNHSSLHHVLPAKEHIQALPLFQSLPAEKIHLIQTLEHCRRIEPELKSTVLLGFDSESKPTFNKGEAATGPHLIQLATQDCAYLFQVSPEILEFLKPVFASRQQIKAGFGLKNDAHLFRKKGLELNSAVELSKCFKAFGLDNPVGLKNAMALLFRVNFPKSKSVSTSNWSKKHLSPQQIAYAAADAYAPVLVFEELRRLGLLPQEILNSARNLRGLPSQTKPASDA